MFADPNYNGKFQNEYEGIENASVAPPMTYEEAVEKAREIISEIISPLLPMFKEIAESVKAAITAFVRVNSLVEDLIENYPNKRVAHLAKHSKKYRVRKKNINRILNDRIHSATMF